MIVASINILPASNYRLGSPLDAIGRMPKFRSRVLL
jgi:hypothetical protein